MTLRDSLAIDQRPRERLLKYGAEALTTAELLAVVLGSGTKNCHAVDFAHKLLDHHKGLRQLLATNTEDLQTLSGVGKAKACQLGAISALARRAIEEEMKYQDTLEHPERVKTLCKSLLGHLQIEHCVALFLDNQNRLITTEEVSKGTLTQTSIYPRELIKAGLKHHAKSLILAHNHPSGLAQASAADIELTQILKQSLSMVDIDLLDHVIVAGHRVISMAERSLL